MIRTSSDRHQRPGGSAAATASKPRFLDPSGVPRQYRRRPTKQIVTTWTDVPSFQSPVSSL